MGTQLFGCHIGVINRILGGRRGNSGGNVNRALKNPPSLLQTMNEHFAATSSETRRTTSCQEV